MENKVSRLNQLSEKLNCNAKIASDEFFDDDYKVLLDDWSRVSALTKLSLETLWKCHYSWMDEQIKALDSCITHGASMIDEEVEFINSYPFQTIHDFCGIKELSIKVTKILQLHEVLHYAHESLIHVSPLFLLLSTSF